MKLTVNVDDRIVAIARRAWGLARHRASHFILAACVLAGAGAIAHATTKKHTFTSGTPALAAEVNENFDDVFAAVTAVEDELAAGREQSIMLAGAAANRNLAVSNSGYFYLYADDNEAEVIDTDTFGFIDVPIPLGSVVTAMTCYVYNNSTIAETDETRISASLRKRNMSDISAATTVVASMSVWPEQQHEIQAFSATVTSSNATLAENSSYILQLQIEPGTATAAEIFPSSASCDADCARVLRHYGCRIDYELP